MLLLLSPLLLTASEPLPFNLTYPTATKSSEVKSERYDKLEVYIKGEGYRSVYGETWEQEFEYPEFENDSDQQRLKDFMIKALDINASDISKEDIGHFFKADKEYWLKLSLSSTSYDYLLLRVDDYPEKVSFDANATPIYAPKFEKRHGKVPFESNSVIPLVKGYGIDGVTYRNYDEHTFYYNRSGHLHKGKFYEIDFTKITDDPNSDRYGIAHEYKDKLLALGATVLKDKDNEIIFKFEKEGALNIIKFSGGDSSFSITIIQEEPFKQSLVLTPDAIKTELDKTGKITLDGIYFDFNKATLKPESSKAILSTVALMQRYPDLVLSVHGHTDNRGTNTYNTKLSSERADSVMKAIIAEGIDASRLRSKGHGEDDPIASNDTDEGRAQNRRVELHKESGGDKKSIITIDFIKPIENSHITETKTYQNDTLGIQFTQPYSKEKHYEEFKGTHKHIGYDIIKDAQRDSTFSRKAIIKNYENVLELYNAKILGKQSNTLYFEIADRGDGKKIYGRIEAYTGSYSIRFLIEE